MHKPIRFVRVTEDYESAYPDPILLKAGDEVTISDRESEWAGWLWCATIDGRCGWVPEGYLRRQGDKGFALCDYDATELTAVRGELLEVILEESEWYWCRDAEGHEGWLPVSHVEETEEEEEE